MEDRRYLELLEQDGTAMAEAAERDLRAQVPSCPEWDVAELVRHTGLVHRHKAATVRRGGTDYTEDLEVTEGPEADTELMEWYRAGLDDLLATLSSADPETPAWSWSGDHRVAFWNRRMAQETAVHRWDAENAVGAAGSIDPELAADGVDEMLGVFIPGEGLVYEGSAGSIYLHCTDLPDEWIVTLPPGRVPTYERGPGAHDAGVAGTAEELLLLVWRRIELDRVEVEGARSLVTDFWQHMEGPGQ
jgi:uncharacterized protein (TIGR03083 family)